MNVFLGVYLCNPPNYLSGFRQLANQCNSKLLHWRFAPDEAYYYMLCFSVSILGL